MRAGARIAGPPPARRLPGRLLAGAPIEVDRTVNPLGMVSLGNTALGVGSVLAGQRVTIRLERDLAHVVAADGTLWRTVAFTLTPAKRARLQGARPAGPAPTPPTGPVRVERKVSSRGGIQVVNQRVQGGLGHAGTVVTVQVDDNTLCVMDDSETILKTVPRLNTQEVRRHKAYGHRTVNQA